MKYSSFIVSGFRKEGRDYPDWGTIMSLNERRYLSSIDWFWKDHNALHLLLHEKRFAEKMACKAKNYKVCQYWCDRADQLSRRIRIDRHWKAKFNKALACEQWEKARRILHVACGSFTFIYGKQLAWTWSSFQNRPISDFPNNSIPDPPIMDDVAIEYKPFPEV